MAKKARKTAKKTSRKAVKKTAKKVAKASATTARKKKLATTTARKVTTKLAARKAVRPKIDPLSRSNYTAVTPMLTVQDVAGAVDFYTRAFGFKSKGVMNGPDGRPVHAELKLRDATVMLGPESLEQGNLSAKTIGNTPTTLYILVHDADKVFNDAVQAGGQPVMPVADMFWGDRCGVIRDPEGHNWMVATHKANVTAGQIEKALRAMAQAQKPPAASAASASGSSAGGAESFSEY